MAGSTKSEACGKNVRPRGVSRWLKTVKLLIIEEFYSENQAFSSGQSYWSRK